MTKTYSYTPYPANYLTDTAKQILVSQEKAEYIIAQWLNTRYKPASDLRHYSYIPGGIYVSDKRLGFTQISSHILTNPGNVAFWTGVQSPTARIQKNELFFSKLGCFKVVDKNSARVAVAHELSMHNYANISSKLTLFSPCAVAFILLTARTEEGKSFRKFLGLNLPTKPFYTKKLFATYSTLEHITSVKENA